MALNAAAISEAIAALSVSGVTIKDVGEIPQSVTSRDCPILFPIPGAWLDGGNAVSETESTFGVAGSRYWETHTILRYVYLRTQVGTGRSIEEHYVGAVTDIQNIITAMTGIDVADVDLESINHNPIGNVPDAADKKFFGCNFSFTFRQRINA